MSFAYITLLYSDSYLPGALVVAHSLISNGSTIPRAILITDGVSEFAKSELSKVFDFIIPVHPVIADDQTPGFQLLGRPELANAYTKIHVWNQTQFSKVVFLDADTLPIKNIDELFGSQWLDPEKRPDDIDSIAAAPDIGWPDIFNSGVFVACPNTNTYERLKSRALDSSGKYSFDGGDQGLLNQYFGEGNIDDSHGGWRRIPFIYNVTPSTSYQYLPAYAYFHSQVAVVHFIGATKPWQGEAPGNRDMVSKWRTVYREKYGERGVIPPSPRPKNQSTNDSATSDEVPATTSIPSIPSSDESTSSKAAAEALVASFTDFKIVTDESKLIPPPVDRWDATRFVPPLDSKPEAPPELDVVFYSNAWDKNEIITPTSIRDKFVNDGETLSSSSSSGFRFPRYGESTAVLWQTQQPPVERVYPEDLQGPSRNKPAFSQGRPSKRYSSRDSGDTPAPWFPESDPRPEGGFRFPKLGKSVIEMPWEATDRPKVERVYPEDLPPPAYQEETPIVRSIPPGSKYKNIIHEEVEEEEEEDEEEEEQRHQHPQYRPESEENKDLEVNANDEDEKPWDPARKLDELARYSSSLATHHIRSATPPLKHHRHHHQSDKEATTSSSSLKPVTPTEEGVKESPPSPRKFKLKPILKNARRLTDEDTQP